MNHKKGIKQIIVRNSVVFLIVYVFMMGAITYFATDREKSRVYNEASVIYEAFYNIMERVQRDQISATDTYYDLGALMSSAAMEKIYLKADLYNAFDERIASSCNMLVLRTKYETDGKEFVEMENYILLDDYMTIDEINAFFLLGFENTVGVGIGGHNSLPFGLAFLCTVRVTGTNGAQDAVIPQKIELFNLYSDMGMEDMINEKTFCEITSDVDVFGATNNSIVFFERAADTGSFSNSGLISNVDRKRYADCAKMAELSLEALHNRTGFGNIISYEKGYISYPRSMFAVKVVGSVIQQNELVKPSGNGRNSISDDSYHYINFALAYYPLEIAVSQLIPIYIITFFFIAAIMLFLSKKMVNVFNRQIELEMIRRDFINAIAHELKTPLGIIRNYSEGLNEKINEEKRGHYLNVIIEETEHMDAMVLDMLSLSQWETSIELNLQNHALDKIATRVLARYQEAIDKKGIVVETISSNDCVINCDEKWIERVISNFLSNALWHTPEKGRIYIYIEKLYKECYDAIIFDSVYFAVENSGQHIPPEKIAHIWDAFYKTDSARSQAKGAGMGLSIVKSILSAHGFTHEVTNTTVGVRFGFTAKRSRL